MPFKFNRTVVMGAVAVLLTALTLFDLLSGPAGSSGSRTQRSKPAGEAVSEPASLAAPAEPRSTKSSASQAWRDIQAFSQLRENAPLVTKRYQSLAVPYAELMAEVAVVHGAEETPEVAAKRAFTAMLPPTVQIKAFLVADGAVSQQGNTLLTVNLSLESIDSQAMQQAITMLGNPAAGLVWQELTLSADTEKRLIVVSGLLSVLAVRYAE
jgi:hypothetical protein